MAADPRPDRHRGRRADHGAGSDRDRSGPGGTRAPAAPVSAAAARRAAGTGQDAGGTVARVRRRIERALRRRRAAPPRIALRGHPDPARASAPRAGHTGRSVRRVPRGLRHPAGSARPGVRDSHRRMPAADTGACGAPGRREFHHRVRHRQVVERLQLVSGQLPQSDPGRHRPADLYRSRDRSGVSRGLPRTSCLQRAARAPPGPRTGMARVLRLCALLPAVADRGRHRQLRDRGRVPERGTTGVRAGGAVSGRRAGPVARDRVLPGRRAQPEVCRNSPRRPRRPDRRPRH